MRTVGALLISVVIGTPFAASAEGMTGGVTFGYGMSEMDIIPFSTSTDLDNWSIGGRVAFDMGNGWSLNAAAGHVNVDIDALDTTVTGDRMSFGVAYAFGNGAWAGVYGENGSIGIPDSLPIDFSSTSYGIEGGYKAAGYEFSAFYGADGDITNYGLAGKYTGVEGLELGASVQRTNVEFFGSDTDLDFVGVAAAYTINAQFNVFGGWARTSIDDADADLTTYGIGVGYDMSSFSKVPMIASIEVARTDITFFSTDVAEQDTVRIGLTLPLGGAAASKVPLNSVADPILNPSHGALSQTIMTMF